ncbi:MAG TPA: helix-turn-helix transcriptional regulator [Rhabdochlamydiaceae bacterium]|jgi:putative transcriptional regulator
MPIVVNLDILLAKKKVRSKEIADAIGLTEQNLSILKTGKAKAMRFSTLEALCRVLQCQPGDILAYAAEEELAVEVNEITVKT